MITLNNLQIWDLTKNQAKVLSFFIKNRHRNDLSFKKIKNEIRFKKSFYRELLQELIDKKFLFVLKDRRPITYYFNDNRFKEKLQENQNEYLKNRENFELLFEKLKDEKNISKILEFAQAQLRLTNEQLLILNALLSKTNDKATSNSVTLKQIGQELKKDNTKPTIRYNLSILEKRGFITQQKIGRTNFYMSKSLKSIIESEQKFQENLWNEKKKIMEGIIQVFQKKPEKVPEKVKNFEVLINFEEIKKSIIKLIKNTERELILDLRCSFEGTNQVLEFVRDIFYTLLELLNKKEEIKVKFLLSIDDWLIHKLDNIFHEFITKIHPEKFEFRVPIERGKREFKLIIDEKTLFQMIGVYELSLNENGLIINNTSTARQVKLGFNQIWYNSLDIRDSIIEYTIKKDLKKVIKLSEKKYQPEYNFTDKFIVINGTKKSMRFLLHFVNSAKSEVLMLIGPLFTSREGTSSIVETLIKEKYYDKLNSLIERKCKEGLSFKWLRNYTGPNVVYQMEGMRKYFIDLVLSLFPNFQQRQFEARHYQFVLIDQKILCIVEYSEEFKLRLYMDDFIINKYNLIFEKIWSEAYDIRLQWLIEFPENLREYVYNTFNKIKLQITLPKDGKTKRFDGKFFKPILNFFLNNAKREIYTLLTNSTDLIQNKENFYSQIMPYILDFYNCAKNSSILMKIIMTYSNRIVKLISDKDLKINLEMYPRYQVHFIPNKLQPDVFFGIFDNYILRIIGRISSDNSHLIIMNDKNLIYHYKEQFNSFWNDSNSIDLRQILHEYGSPKNKKLILDSYKKYKLEKKLDSEQVRKLFPKS